MPSHTGLKWVIVADTHCHWGLSNTDMSRATCEVRNCSNKQGQSSLYILIILPFFTLGEKITLSRVDIKNNTHRRRTELPQNSPNHHENKLVLICTSSARKFSPMMLGFSHQTKVKWTCYFGLKKSSIYPHFLPVITFTTTYSFSVALASDRVKEQ